MSVNFVLSPEDTYALVQALIGLPWDGYSLSPAVALLFAHLVPYIHEDLCFLH